VRHPSTMTTMTATPVEHLARFGRLLLESGDLDPEYPVLRALSRDDDEERRLWRVFVFLAFCDLSSSIEVCDAVPTPSLPCARLLGLPVAVVRRGLRSLSPMIRHFGSYLSAARFHGTQAAFLFKRLPTSQREAWREVSARVQAIYGNGRWAGFKACDLYANVCGAKIEAPDMAHAASSGPRSGLALFFGGDVEGNAPAAIAELDRRSDEITARLRVEFGLAVGLAEVETILCKFHSLAAGRYYAGKDLDEMLGEVRRPSVPGRVRERVLTARAAAFPVAWLAELRGEAGVDRARCRAYLERGEILGR